MTLELQTLSTLVKMLLEHETPILSGNMEREIMTAKLVSVNDHEITFCINAPFYDVNLWKQKGVIVHTGSPKKWPSMTDYANWVNQIGAFGTHNKSMHWVNRAVNDAARMIPNAEIINKLELS